MYRTLIYIALLAAPLSAAGQDIDFGDDSGNYPNDGECDDPRFEGPGAYSHPLDDDILRDATDCLTLFGRGQVWLVGESPEYFGALAIGADLGYGGMVSVETQEEADKAALSNCSTVDSGCAIVARFGADMCVAVAVDDAAGTLGWATGPDSQETANVAINECIADGGGGNCSIRDFACNSVNVSSADSTGFAHAIETELASVRAGEPTHYPNGISIGTDVVGPVRITVDPNPNVAIYVTRGRFVPIVYGFGPDSESAEASCTEVLDLESERNDSTYPEDFDSADWCVSLGDLRRVQYPNDRCLGTALHRYTVQVEAGLVDQINFSAPTVFESRAAAEDYMRRLSRNGAILVTFCW